MLREFAMQRYSWAKVAVINYGGVLHLLDEKTTMHSPVQRKRIDEHLRRCRLTAEFLLKCPTKFSGA